MQRLLCYETGRVLLGSYVDTPRRHTRHEVVLNISIGKDVVYGVHDRPLHWDIYRPSAPAAGAPGVLVVHGGGYRSGDRSDVADVCVEYARRGYVAIACEYRYLTETRWPGPLDDVKLALQTFRRRSVEFGVSPEHIFLTGFSCGAQMCLLAGGTLPGVVAGVACAYGPTRLGEAHGRFLNIEDPAVVVAASPIEYAAQLPPTILFYGAEDPATPQAMGLDLYTAINQAGGTADIRLFSHMIHGFVLLPGMHHQLIGDAVRFFERTAINKESFTAACAAHQQWWARATAALKTN